MSHDENVERTTELVHPAGWGNPTPRGRYHLVVIGGGTAGLVSAVGAAQLGASVALIEKHLLGGDCLNYGCVPSKGIIRAARAVEAVREAGEFGVRTGPASIDFAAAMDRMRRLQSRIARNDSAERLRSLGADVFLGRAKFVSRSAVDVDGRRLEFARAIIATGGRAMTLPVPGLAEAGYLTNETVFSLRELPRRLTVVGAGPIGCELAQTFRRFGSEVTIVSLDPTVVPKEDPDAAAILDARLRREGISLELGTKLVRVERDKTVVFDRGAVASDAILLAVGRVPGVEDLGLDAAGVAYGKEGVLVDDQLRTTNRHIFAAGDVASKYQFTHAADALARIALQNALFFGRKRQSALVVPWATYTDPEIAHVGANAGPHTFNVKLDEIDRAILDGETEGFARIHADERGRILGATMVARHAGEMIGEISVAMTNGLTLADLARSIHPYPTQAEVWKKLGDAWMRTKLTPRTRQLIAGVLRFRPW